jgi:hypothetical protein
MRGTGPMSAIDERNSGRSPSVRVRAERLVPRLSPLDRLCGRAEIQRRMSAYRPARRAAPHGVAYRCQPAAPSRTWSAERLGGANVYDLPPRSSLVPGV